METKITLNLSESEFKALTVVCKALRTTPEAVVRASARKLFENPMDFMFEAFSNEAMGFQMTEGKPSSQAEQKPVNTPVKETVAPAPAPTQSAPKKTSEPKPVEKPAEKLPSMGVAQFREKHFEVLDYIGINPRCLVKDILLSVFDINGYDYVGSDKNFRHFLEGMRDNGEIIIDTKDGVRCSIKSVKADAPANPLTSGIILSASGKYRKPFYATLAKASTKVVKPADFKYIFHEEGFDGATIIPAIEDALEDLAKKRLIIFSGKNGGKITLLEKFREKIYKTYPELKAVFPTNA